MEPIKRKKRHMKTRNLEKTLKEAQKKRPTRRKQFRKHCVCGSRLLYTSLSSLFHWANDHDICFMLTIENAMGIIYLFIFLRHAQGNGDGKCEWMKEPSWNITKHQLLKLNVIDYQATSVLLTRYLQFMWQTPTSSNSLCLFYTLRLKPVASWLFLTD